LLDIEYLWDIFCDLIEVIESIVFVDFIDCDNTWGLFSNVEFVDIKESKVFEDLIELESNEETFPKDGIFGFVAFMDIFYKFLFA